MKVVYFLLFVLTQSFIFSQNTVNFNVICKNQENSGIVKNASIEIKQNERIFSCKTNGDGKCSFQLSSDFDLEIKISHAFYGVSTHFYPLKKEAAFDSNLELEIVLTKIQLIDPIDILPAGVSTAIYESKELSVADFEILNTKEILLLLYPKTLKKGSELAILNGRDITGKFNVPEKPLELIHDFRGNPHVICETGIYGIHREGKEVGISTLERSYFMKYVFPIVDTSFSKFYFSNFNKNYPAFDYKVYDQLDSTYSDIVEIKDELMMELYRSEYKWVDIRTKLWAKQLEMETGIDKEIWVGANYFTQSIYYKELYAPMFKKNDSIFVFDYYKDKLFTFNLKGEKVDSVAIFHHYEPKKTGWRRNVLQDKETGKIYAFFEKDGFCSLRLINTKTGLFESNVVFEHKYIDKIAVSDGNAYYIYRPFESAQKKFLYRTKLP